MPAPRTPTRKPKILAALSAFDGPATDLAKAYEPVSQTLVFGFRTGLTVLPPESAQPRGGMPFSNHQRLSLVGRYARPETNPLLPLRELIDHLPPLRPRSADGSWLEVDVARISWSFSDEFSEGFSGVVRLDGVEFKGTANQVAADLARYIRIHEHLEMSSQLHPWALLSQPKPPHVPIEPIWADDARNAALRIAAFSKPIFENLRVGLMPAIKPAPADPSPAQFRRRRIDDPEISRILSSARHGTLREPVSYHLAESAAAPGGSS